MPEVIGEDGLTDREREAAKVAAAHLEENPPLVLSGHQISAKIAWTIRPWLPEAIRQSVEAHGNAPYRVLEIMTLDRRATRWPGAPFWAQNAYLVLVEVKATIAGSNV